MGRLQLLVFLIVSMAATDVQSRDHHCYRLLQEDGLMDDVTSELMFLPRTASVRNTCHRQHRELMCCAHNFQSLRWHRFDNTSQTWTEVELSSHVYHRPEGDPRKLVLERPDFSDAGWYRCVAANDLGQEIIHNISLRVHECAAMDHAPVLSSPLEGVLYRQLGSEVSLTCHAYFGPNYDNDLVVYLLWEYEKVWENGTLAGKDVWIPKFNGLPLYTPTDPRLQQNISFEWDTQISTLTIHNITSADYGNYSCRAKNSIGWSKRRTVVLRRGDPDRLVKAHQPDRVGPLLSCTLSVIVGATICVSLLVLFWRKDIQLLYKDNLDTPRNSDAHYDALVIHTLGDPNPDFLFVVETLLPCLEDKYGYQLCIPERDFLAGPDLVDVIVDNIHRSQAVMFIVTEAMLQHEWCDFVFQYVAAQGFTNLVFIRYEPIRGEAWQSNQGPMRNVMNTSKHVISWPADQRKRDTFWKDVRLSLPPKLRPLKQNRQQEWEGKHELDYV